MKSKEYEKYCNYFIKLIRSYHHTPTFEFDAGIKLLYNDPLKLPKIIQIDSTHKLYELLPYRPQQAKNNCYAKSHETGFWLRIGRNGSILNTILIGYILRKIHQNLIDLRHKLQLTTLFEWHKLCHSKELPEYILNCIRHYYQSQMRIKRLFSDLNDPGQPIDEIYINLVIVSTEDIKQLNPIIQTDSDSLREDISNSYKDIQPSRTSFISPSNIWERKFFQGKHHIIVSGRAGIGKSTFCQFIAYEWANGKLWGGRINQIFWIKLRDLKILPQSIINKIVKSNNKHKRLSLIVQYLCAPNLQSFSSIQIEKKISEGNAVWLLDGYDEVIKSRDNKVISNIKRFLGTRLDFINITSTCIK